MAGVNKVILLGNLGKDPSVSYTPGGMAVCKFSLATSRKKKDGEEVTSWHRCTAFDRRGEAIGQYVKKGQQLYIEGELSYGEYEKDGVKVYTTDIIVGQFSFVGSKSSSGGQQGNQNARQQEYQGGQQGGYQNPPQQGQQQGGYQGGQQAQQGGYQQPQQGQAHQQQGGYQQNQGQYQNGQPVDGGDSIPF